MTDAQENRRFFSGFTFGAFCLMTALLMIITVGTEIVLRSDVHPRTKFQSMLWNTLVGVFVAGMLIEWKGLHLLDN